MSLHIKNPETHDLAQTLARETGVTITHAVTEALRERLQRVRRQRQAVEWALSRSDKTR